MSTLATNAITDASGGNTATINGQTPTESNMAGRNRIINGDMRIDARNAGASVTMDAATQFAVDRFSTNYTTAIGATLSIQQVTDAPSGFNNSYKFTVTTGASTSGTQGISLWHRIEGNNVADLAFGTAAAQDVTISFWVKSTLTGTFGGGLLNSAFNRSYPFTYTISSANTWEYKTVTIPGDTTGTWLTNNGTGMLVSFDWGTGDDRRGTAGAWVAARAQGALGAVKAVETTGATWQITGVQLEAGSVATPFERRLYGQELALCQRYYEQTTEAVFKSLLVTYSTGGSDDVSGVDFMVSKRTTPTCTISGNNDAANSVSYYNSSATNFTVSSVDATPERITRLVLTTNVVRDVSYKFTASAEL
jgi:hypothetical protein